MVYITSEDGMKDYWRLALAMLGEKPPEKEEADGSESEVED